MSQSNDYLRNLPRRDLYAIACFRVSDEYIPQIRDVSIFLFRNQLTMPVASTNSAKPYVSTRNTAKASCLRYQLNFQQGCITTTGIYFGLRNQL
jgi:hypothetical protein